MRPLSYIVLSRADHFRQRCTLLALVDRILLSQRSRKLRLLSWRMMFLLRTRRPICGQFLRGLRPGVLVGHGLAFRLQEAHEMGELGVYLDDWQSVSRWQRLGLLCGSFL